MNLARHKKSKHIFQAQGYYRYFQKPQTNFLLTPGSGQQPKIAVRPFSPGSQIDQEMLTRFARRTVMPAIRKIAPKFVPILGWVLLGKDIYDLATD